MKKLLSLTLVVAFGLTIAFTGCKKYEEGPTLSLASKKARVVNTWKLEKYTVNGVDIPLLSTTSYMELKKDNTFIMSYGSSANTGTWDFDSKKENIVFTENGSSSADKEEILRLKSGELWLKSVDGTDVVEIHYVKN